MKITNEVKVGAVALITIIAFIMMFSFLKGTALFTSTDTYHVIYDNIAGLTESNPVEINGYQAGVVQDIKLINDGSGQILVSLSVDRHFNIPKDTKAEITTATLIAGMKIILRMGESKEMCHNHDTIAGYVATPILERLGDVISPLENNISDIIVNLDSAITVLTSLLTPEMTNEIKSAVSNINNISTALDEVAETRKDDLSAAIEELKVFTAVLSSNSTTLDSTLKNIEGISEAFASADLPSTLASLRSSLTNLDEIIKSMGSGEGSAGKLITDDSLYTNLNNSLYNLDLLLKDMKEDPKKYVHFSIFGKNTR